MQLDADTVAEGIPMPWLHGQALAVIDPEAIGKKAEKKRFPFVRVADMLANYKPPKWLVEGMIEEGSISMVFGESTAGKSFLVIDWAACIATGRAWHGRTVDRGPVFYLAGEGFSGFCRRLRAWELASEQSLQAAPLFFSERPASLMDAASAAEVIEAVKALCDEHGKPALIVIDTLHRNLGPGDENNAQDIAMFLQGIDGMRSRLGVSVLIVHHSGHTQGNRARGSSSIRASLDSEFMLAKDSSDRRELTCTKQKDAPTPDKMYFRLRQVELDLLDAKGRQDNSAVLALDGDQQASEAVEKKIGKPHAAIIKAISIIGSNEKEAVRTQFYAIYPGDQEAQRKSFGRGWKDYMDSLESEA